MTKKLHIICFNIPSPPDYGGVIDIYYKLEALANEGTEIHLHCFEYDRPRAADLSRFCKEIYYYPRKTGFKAQLSTLPYIVRSRKHPKLLRNLSALPAPILFEGLHTCFLLGHPLLAACNKLVRAHNIEHQYYYHLSSAESNLVKRVYYLIESIRLSFFERKLALANHILAISTSEEHYFQQTFKKAKFIPAFHPYQKVSSKTGKGDYLLFHGNLSVSENQNAVKFLMREVFTQITISFVIAGKNPPEWLISMANDIPHVMLVANPSTEQMNTLIREAHVCLIPTFQTTGVKLKLLASLFCGRHCLTNSMMVKGTGLKNLCHIADTAEDMVRTIRNLMEIEFDSNEIEKRKVQLATSYSNEANARKIMELI
ncbi:hypothetical protein [Mangrovibacterium sp.]|uniref:hypothetical protein n=1 Tax=Mangrovibacterium sp. TaxID=1961364 RepID=UPI003563EB39